MDPGEPIRPPPTRHVRTAHQPSGGAQQSIQIQKKIDCLVVTPALNKIIQTKIGLAARPFSQLGMGARRRSNPPASPSAQLLSSPSSVLSACLPLCRLRPNLEAHDTSKLLILDSHRPGLYFLSQEKKKQKGWCARREHPRRLHKSTPHPGSGVSRCRPTCSRSDGPCRLILPASVIRLLTTGLGCCTRLDAAHAANL